MLATQQNAVKNWLGILCILLLCMIALGGITRLTLSGLSIVEWRPVTGILPPLSENQWMEEFSKYQASPQYKIVNQGMPLSEFKKIFFWEYFHRLLGRIIGLVFFIPLIIFWKQKRFSSKTKKQFLVLGALGCFQGFMGWYMVASGLMNEPQVSHLRLAAHLLIAFCILGVLFWMRLEVSAPQKRLSPPASNARLNVLFVCLLLGLWFLQSLYGAFLAGLKAGKIFNTFPKMEEHWFPPGIFAFPTLAQNLFYNPTWIQFFHRSLGIGLTFFSIIFLLKARPPLRKSLSLVMVVVILQATLGILTLLWHVPLSTAVLHQIGSGILLLAIVNTLHITVRGVHNA